jgi:hypothetical protein
MIKRPLNPQFSNAVREGRKFTTIREKPWPVGVPIMLYNWSGVAYRSQQIAVAAVIVREVRAVEITHRFGGDMLYIYGPVKERRLHETEGFASRAELDDWFRPLIKRGETIEKWLMFFSLANEAVEFKRIETKGTP